MIRKNKVILIYFSLIAAWILFNSRAANPPNGRTNSPFDGFCADCHSPSGSQDGTVSISGLPAEVDAGQTYNVTITVDNTQGNAARAGFQMVSVYSTDNSNAGDFIPDSGDEGTDVSSGREYIEHRGAKNFIGNQASWSFDWMAPDGVDGAQITMYYAGLIANGNGGSSGDRAKSGSSTFNLKATGDPLTVSITEQTDVSCNGENDGSATASGAGGTPPYTYSWSNGTNSATATNLDAGNYTVTVTDNAMQTSTEMVTIAEPNALTLTSSITDVDCNGENSGSINLSVNGGTPPYNYSWSNGLSTRNISSLSAGGYTVTLTDANDCVMNETFMVSEPDQIVLELSSTDESAFMANDGTASVQASGGNGNFTYNWSNGGSTQIVENLIPGMYSVTVSDGAGCDEIGMVTIQAFICSLEASVNSTSVSCFGDPTGMASVDVTGATTPVTYQWSTQSSGNMVTGLSTGMYDVTVSDGAGCQSILAFEITEPDSLMAMTGIINTICPGDSSGSIVVNVSGGTAPYTYNWSNGSMANSLSNLIAGNYTLTVSDDNGCTLDLNSPVIQVDSIPPVAIAQDVTVYADSMGSVLLSPDMVDNGSSDNCGIDTLWLSRDTLFCPEGDSSFAILTVRDESGLIDSDTAQIVYMDSIAPVFTSCPQDITTDSGLVVTYELPEALDNCFIDSLVMTEGLPSGSVFPVGETKVSYMATDHWENITCCSFFVNVGMSTTSNDVAQTVFNISPNPFYERIQLEKTDNESFDIQLFSTTGRLVYRKNWESASHIIQTSRLQPSIYFLKIQQGNTTLVRKLVKY